MSYDLGALSAVQELSPDQAADIYARLCDGQPWDSLLAPDPNVEAFVAEITRRWPQLDDVPADEVDNCPWSVNLDVSPAHAIAAMVWSRADDVGPAFIEMATRHHLNVFDPQEGILHSAGQAPRGITPRKASARTCARCGKPIGSSELSAELPGAPGIYHLGCLLGDWPTGASE